MNNINSRTIKILIGSSLIGITLLSGSNETGTTPVLALVAVPFVTSGIVDWSPVKWCATKLVGYAKPLLAQAKFTSHHV